jgi:hypothetical protein
MQGRGLSSGNPIGACLLVALAALAAALPCAGSARAAARAHPPAAGLGRERAEAERVERYWTPARMRSARPLDLALRGGRPARAPAAPTAAASFLPVETPETPPFSFNGRIFVRQGRLVGFCSGTAIDTPTRQLVLTAGHCVNSGPFPTPRRRASIWSRFLEFVPAYNGGVAPFGSFVARRSTISALKQWTGHGNPDYDIGAFLTQPGTAGLNLADAVGGGATIVADLPRAQQFQTFGYPGETTRMQSCRSPYIGDDVLTNLFPGPPTMAVHCHWAPGASGGGWLIAEGTEINGINSYLHLNDRSRTFGPYFSRETVGRLVAGL